MDKNLGQSRQERMRLWKTSGRNSAQRETMSSENTDQTTEDSIDSFLEHIAPVLLQLVARKEETLDSIIQNASLRLRPGPEKSFEDELHTVQSSSSSFTSPFETRTLERSDSSIRATAEMIGTLKSASSSTRGPLGQSGIGRQGRRVESETNESLMMPVVGAGVRHAPPARAQGLQVQVATQSMYSSRGGGSNSREGSFSLDQKESDLCLPLISWEELKTIEDLGTGQFAAVRLALWRGVKVAFKEWHSLTDEESKDMALQEAKTLALLLHPCVLSIYGIVKDGPSPGLVIEYLPHCSLLSQLQKMKGTEKETKKFKIMIALRAALGMDFLHRRSVIHFDLKCENLLCDLRDLENPVVKVGDVGLSKLKAKTFISGNMRGTLPWMAPELFPAMQHPNLSTERVSDLVNEKVDIYSFGVVLWEIWEMGEMPYPKLSSYDLIKGIVEGTLELKCLQECDQTWEDLMKECLSRDRNKRPSFESIVERLTALHEELQSSQEEEEEAN